MQRRRFIETAAAGSIVGIAGCQGSPSGTDTSDGGIGTPTPESGEEDNYEQVREIELMTFTRDFAPLRYQAVNETRNAWQELGVSVNLRSAELSTLFAEYNEQTYDATLMWFSTGADRADPSFYINLFKSEYIDTSGVNPAAFDSEEYDEYANTALTSTDEEERVQAAKDAQRVLAGNNPSFGSSTATR
jgi:ABC-type transport system substrate-binding protein